MINVKKRLALSAKRFVLRVGFTVCLGHTLSKGNLKAFLQGGLVVLVGHQAKHSAKGGLS